MDANDDEPAAGSAPVTRRAFLGGVAATPAAVPAVGALPLQRNGQSATSAGRSPDAVTSTATPTTTATATVLTRNLYLGVDLSRLFEARSMADVRAVAGELLAEARGHPYRARIDAIAAEIDRTDAAVVGVQEAALVRTQRPSDFGSDSPEAATTVEVDLLSDLVAALAERGHEYEVAATSASTDVELPADTGDGRVDLRLTDRDAVLVRSDVDVDPESVRSGRYDASLTLPVPGSDRWISIGRGYCLVDVTVEGTAFTVASTHLESVSAAFRRRQARELVDLLPTGRPLVVLGDFNSGPGTTTDAYDRLTRSLDDAHAAVRPDADGFTCCQAHSLRNGSSRLDERVDAVLYRGAVRPQGVQRVGDQPDDRVPAQIDGETAQIWPSDHAGVAATLAIGPRQTATATTARSTAPATATPESTTPATSLATTTGSTTTTDTTTTAGPPETTRSASSSATPRDSLPWGLAGSIAGAVALVAGASIGVLARSRRE